MTLNFGPFSKHTCQLTLLAWSHMVQAREKSRTLMPPALGSVSSDVRGGPFDVSVASQDRDLSLGLSA